MGRRPGVDHAVLPAADVILSFFLTVVLTVVFPDLAPAADVYVRDQDLVRLTEVRRPVVGPDALEGVLDSRLRRTVCRAALRQPVVNVLLQVVQ